MEYKDINDNEILYLIKEKDDYYNDYLYKKYKPIIKKIAYKYSGFIITKGADYDDLVQEGYIGFSSAIATFDVSMKNTFYTFAILCVERSIQNFCKKLSALKNEYINNSVELNEYTDYNKDLIKNKDMLLDDIYTEFIFFKYKNILNLKNSTVFEMRYNGFSYLEISKLLDISVGTVDSRLCKVRKILLECENKT